MRPDAGFSRTDLARHLDAKRIATRQLFAGNLLRQPAYEGLACRTVNALPNTDYVMRQTFWLGVYPGLASTQLDYVIDTIHRFVADTRTR